MMRLQRGALLQPTRVQHKVWALAVALLMVLLMWARCQQTSRLMSVAVAKPSKAATIIPSVDVDPQLNPAKPIPSLQSRADLAQLLEAENMRTGAELGVLFGEFAEHMLNCWRGCTMYYLVDLWDVQENYKDMADTNKAEQDRRFQSTQERLAPWKDKTKYLRMYTTQAADKIPDLSLDFVYIDARHDYCGVREDLVAYWSKVRSGGILAGHDYMDAHHQLLKETNQDWSVCMNGTVNWGAVKGAVDEFAEAHGLTITTTKEPWATWVARKP